MDGINLALLPKLNVVQQIDYEQIVIELAQQAAVQNLSPSDPAYRVVLASAYRELMLRQDANEQALGLTLAHAHGAELDHIGATYYKHPNGTPVLRLSNESDQDYKARLQSSPEGLSVAGPEGGYIFHAISASPLVKSVSVDSPAPVEIDLYILTREGNGIPDSNLLEHIKSYIWPMRPLTDLVRVNPAEILEYEITAKLIVKPGPDPELVRVAAENAAIAFVELKRQLNSRVVQSSVHAVLTVEGVEEVKLIGWKDIICNPNQAAFCRAMNVTIEED